MVLYDAPRDAGSGCYMHIFSVVPSWCSVHPVHRSQLRWLQKFCNGDGMLARWYMLLGQFSVTTEYRPGAQHANADGMSRQCGQCSRPDCPVSSSDSRVIDVDSTTVLLDQLFASSEMGDSMDADLLPELSGETWVAATLLEVLTADLPPVSSLTIVREWVQSGATSAWSECSGLSPELWCWRLQIVNLSVDTEEIVAPPGSSVKGLSTRGNRSGVSGYDSPIS